MHSFTEEIKNEIIQYGLDKDCCKIAFLSAFARTGGNVIYYDRNYGLELITENERVAEFVTSLFETVFGVSLTVSGASRDVMRGKDKLTFSYVGKDGADIIGRLGLVNVDGTIYSGISGNIIEDDCCKISYIKGAFLGGGSCTLPDEQTYSRTGYHFEVVFPDRVTATDYCELLCDFEILAKFVMRKENSVVYVKSKEVISDILSLIKAERCLDKLNKIVEFKDKINNDNRLSNCCVSNIDKAVTASVAQIKAIEIISQTIGLQRLEKNLFEVAEARLADRNASLKELADRLGITKSCINHRMRKIIDISNQLS